MPNIELPENWSVKQVPGDGDCFFHAVANGLNAQIKAEFPFENLAKRPGEKAETEFSAKLLRKICHKYALEQLELTNSWLKKEIKGDTNRYESLENYAPRILYTAEDIERKGSLAAEQAAILGLKEVVWGDVIESKIICAVLDKIINDSSKKISIHTIEAVNEELIKAGIVKNKWLHNVINPNYGLKSGEKARKIG